MNDAVAKSILEKLIKIEDSIVGFRVETCKRLDGVDKRLDGVDERLDGVDERLGGVEGRLGGVEGRLDGVEGRLDGVDKRFDKFAHAVWETFVTRAEFEDFSKYVHENMFTKQDYMNHLSRLDEMISEFKHTRDNNILIGKQLCDLDDTVFRHGKRITVLENKVLK